MRILLVPVAFPSRARPSVGIAILRRAQALASLGHDVCVFTALPLAPPIGKKWSSYRSVPEYDVVGGIPVHTVHVPMLPRLIGFEHLPLLLQRPFQRELDRTRPDVVHASFLLPGGQLVVRQRRVPAIVTAHGYDAYDVPNRRPGLRRACEQAVTGAARVTAVSGFLARHLERLADRSIDVIWNGADEEVFFPRNRLECRVELGLPAKRCIVAFAGHLVRAKGVFELIEAAARIPAAQRPLLVLAGEGAQRGELEGVALQRGVEALFLGRVDHAKIPVLFGAADAVTLPSYYEGLPNVVCEAMLSARAVVATDAGGIPEIVQSERTGLVVPSREVEPLALALQRCCASAQFREDLAANARTFAREHLTWRVSAQKYLRLYEEALEEWNSQRSTSRNRTQYAS